MGGTPAAGGSCGSVRAEATVRRRGAARPASHRASSTGGYPARRRVAVRVAARRLRHVQWAPTGRTGRGAARGGSMKAAVRDRYGTTDVVRVEEVERPTPVGGPGARPGRRRLGQPRATSTASGRSPRSPACSWACVDRGSAASAWTARAWSRRSVRTRPASRSATGSSRDLFSFGAGSFAEYACAPERAFLADPGRPVVRGRLDPAPRRGPRGAGAAAGATDARSGRATGCWSTARPATSARSRSRSRRRGAPT